MQAMYPPHRAGWRLTTSVLGKYAVFVWMFTENVIIGTSKAYLLTNACQIGHRFATYHFWFSRLRGGGISNFNAQIYAAHINSTTTRVSTLFLKQYLELCMFRGM